MPAMPTEIGQGERRSLSLSQNGRRTFLICAGLTAVTLAVYWPVRHFEFLNIDDEALVTDNPFVRAGFTARGVAWAFTTIDVEYWHPLTWLSHMLDCQLFGFNAGAHHLVNVLLHTVNALLLFGVLYRMTAAPWRSAFVAAVFAWHPLHVESVAWIAERKDVLSTLCWMLTLGAYLRYVALPTLRSYGLVVCFFVLGLMAKPMVVTLPVVLLLLDFWPLSRPRTACLIWEKLPLLGLSTLSIIVTFIGARLSGQVANIEILPIQVRIGNAILSYVHYVLKTFWPYGLAVYYPFHGGLSVVAVTSAAVVLVLATALAIRSASRHPHVLTGWGWYLITLSPVVVMVHSGTAAMADRYMYIPSIGLFILVAWLVPGEVIEKPLQRMCAAATATVLLGACAALCWFQVHYWKDSVTLFQHTLDVTTDNFLAHNNLGAALVNQGNVSDAIGHYEQALRIKPDYVLAHFNLGNALIRQGRLPEAVAHLEQAVLLKHGYAEAHYNLGCVLIRLRKLPEAIAHLEQIVRLKPEYAEAHYQLGVALFGQGEVEEAMAHYERSLQIKPDYAEAHNNLAIVLVRLGKVPEAVKHFELALHIRPNYAEAYNNLGNALFEMGKVQEAVGHYEQALRIKPDYAEARNNLARVRSVQ
jgi:tetratricopeptide (TPR) repeat protein